MFICNERMAPEPQKGTSETTSCINITDQQFVLKHIDLVENVSPLIPGFSPIPAQNRIQQRRK